MPQYQPYDIIGFHSCDMEVGNCLNLVDSTSLQILKESYEGLKNLVERSGEIMPVNQENNRALDCSVIRYIHKVNRDAEKPSYDSIRCAFPEGGEVYPGAMITSKLHIQICICNPECIKGFFLPRPVKNFNPHLFLAKKNNHSSLKPKASILLFKS